MLNTTKTPLLIVGATGRLGSLITKYCLQNPNLQVSVLVRNPEKDENLVKEVKNSGGKVVVGDVTRPETLKNSTKDIHTIVSALVGDEKTIFQGQKAILEDALKNDVKRFVPSDFTLAIEKVNEEEHPFIGQRKRFRKHLETTPIKGLHVFNGIFTETLFRLNQRGLHYYQNPKQRIDTTTYEDTAKYVAAAIANPDRYGDLFIHGDEVSVDDVAAIYNNVTGKYVQPENWGTIEDLKEKIAKAVARGEFFKAALLGYQIPIFDGRGKLEKVHNNEFPEIKPTTVHEFIMKNPDIAVLPENRGLSF